MARCPGCGKMASYDDSAEPEVQNEDLSWDEGKNGEPDAITVSGTVRVVLSSACCSEELKDAELEFEVSMDHVCVEQEAVGDYDLDSVEAEMTVRQQTTTTDRKTGKVKPIKNPRYMKTFYGATVTANVKCARCDETISESTDVEEQASAFNDLT